MKVVDQVVPQPDVAKKKRTNITQDKRTKKHTTQENSI